MPVPMHAANPAALPAEVVDLLALLARRNAFARPNPTKKHSVRVFQTQPDQTEIMLGQASSRALTLALRQGWIAPAAMQSAQHHTPSPVAMAMTADGRHALKVAKSRKTLQRTGSKTVIHAPLQRRGPTRNLAESPLDWLHSRRDANGKPMIDAAQHSAGERLRSDFTLAGLTPRLTMSWSGMPSRSRSHRSGAPSSPDTVSDTRMAARQRVDQALSAVGPEHAGILIDVCGYLKGLEAIATAEGWPRRSAKLILQRALTALARHYGLIPPLTVDRTIAQRLRHWGAADYRPTLERWSTNNAAD
ncbi:MAG: DUF6456 domain-containing protein [Hyphomicrobiaceae bacterium]